MGNFFLSNYRHENLIKELTGLNMPSLLAREWAEVPDNLEAVDRQLQRTLDMFIIHCTEVVNVTTSREQMRLNAFIAADLVTMRHYLAEIRERDLALSRFPRFNESIKIANEIKRLSSKRRLNGTPCGEGEC